MPTLAVFIDGESFALECRRTHHAQPDYAALARLIARRWNHALGPVFFYSCRSQNPAVQERQRRFWAAQQAKGITLKFGRMEPNHQGGGYRQKEVDVMIACDLLAGAFHKSFDRAALVSGDTDFGYVIERAAELGLEVGWVYLPTQTHLDRLRDLVPPERRLLIDSKTFRLISERAPVTYPHRGAR
jgi:uncharacterized LabA/DUF88 family protein